MIGSTHEVTNQFDELVDYNLYATDRPLQEALQRAQAGAFVPALEAYGARLGAAASFALAEQANRQVPELRLFDRRGRRIDQVDFHPAWHGLLTMLRSEGLVSLPFEDHGAGRWAAWAAGFYLHGQVEAGTLCPATMTQAAIPVLRQEPALWPQLRQRLFDRRHDARDIPIERKSSIWIGMGMTEKQGGSDLRANTTRAVPVGGGGRGMAYQLRGHKWFYSAPTSDAHLVVARDAHGHSCFFVPRWRPDGTRNAVQIQRLKSKVGNRSNASGEVEFLDAYGVLLGEQGLVQALAYARRRQAFGRALAEHDLMRRVLVDLALESEAAVVLMMRLAQAFERDADPLERAWKRIMTPAAKFWVCKRGVEIGGEVMEIFGGNGYVDDGPIARLFREAPVNSIWEGSGNVMCLDVLRALAREPQAAAALLDDLALGTADESRLQAEYRQVRAALAVDPGQSEAHARVLVMRLVLLAQAVLLRRSTPPAVAEAFIATRFSPHWGHIAGGFEVDGLPEEELLQRALAA